MAVWRLIVRLALAAWVFAMAAMVPLRNAQAYEFEHYAWTYFIALHIGFTERQAYQLASVAFAIDWAEHTGPMPHGTWEELSAAAGDASEENMRVKWRNFHAFFALDTLVNARNAGKTPAEIATLIAAEKYGHLTTLYALGLSQENIGVYIHYLQDTFSHDGFADMFGHGAASHIPDFLSWDPAAARKMTIATFQALRGFYKDVCAATAADYCKRDFRAIPEMSVLQPVLDQLIAANPLPVTIEKPAAFIAALKEYSTLFQQNPFFLRKISNLGNIITSMETFFYIAGVRNLDGSRMHIYTWLKGVPSPDFDAPHRVIVAAVTAAKAADPTFVRGFNKPSRMAFFPAFDPALPRNWLQYDFEKTGSIRGDAKAFEVEDVKLRIDNPNIVVEKVGDDQTGVFRATVKMTVAVEGMAPINFMPELPMVIDSRPGNGGTQQFDTALLNNDKKFEFQQIQEWPIKDVAGKTFNWEVDVDVYSVAAETKTFELKFDETKGAACNSAVDSGGDEGGGVEVDLGGFVGKAGFSWEMYDIKDQMDISVGGVSKTTGCVSGSGTIEFDIAAGMSKATVKVLPNCEATTGTAWEFTFECPLKSAVTADGTGKLLPDGKPGTGTIDTGSPPVPPASTTGSVPPLAGIDAIEIEPNGTDALATPIPPSAIIDAILAAAGDVDYFSLDAPAGELTISITLDTPDGTIAVGVYPAAGGDWLPDRSPPDDGLLVFDLPVDGLYVLHVASAALLTQDAPYGLSTSLRPSPDTNEPNATAGEATPIAIDGTVSGAILSSGDTDVFRIDAMEAGQWTIDTTALPDGLTLGLGVYPATGGDWLPDRSPPDDHRLMVDLVYPGQYMLQVGDVAGARSPDPYTLGLAFAPADSFGEPNNAPGVATPIAGAGTVTGSILSSGDIDVLAFDAPWQGEWTITIADAPPGLALGLGVYPAAGGDWLPDLSAASDSMLMVDLPAPGRYLLQVGDIAGARSAAPYRLDLAFTEGTDRYEPNNTEAAASPIAVGETLSGTVLPNGDIDTYVFDVPDAGELTIDLVDVPIGLNLGLGVYPAGGGDWLPDRTGDDDGQLVVDLPRAGRYVLRLAEASGARSVAPYSVAVSFVPTGDAHEPNNTQAIASPVAATGIIAGAILPSGDVDHYLFDAAGGRFTATIEGLPAGLALNPGVYPAGGGDWLPDRSPPDDNQLVVDLPGPGRYVLFVADNAGGRSPAQYQLSTALQ